MFLLFLNMMDVLFLMYDMYEKGDEKIFSLFNMSCTSKTGSDRRKIFTAPLSVDMPPNNRIKPNTEQKTV